MGDAGLDEPTRAGDLACVRPLIRAGRWLDEGYDAIVVGAGLGGLSAAALLATRGGMRVLVLERHYALGGLAQTFKRRRDEFEVGVHYVGEVHDRAFALRRAFDALTEGRLGWSPFGEVHDRVWIEGREVALGGPRARQRDALVGYAPDEAEVIDQYLADVTACAREAPLFFLARAAPRPVDDARVPFRRFTDVTTLDHLRALGASGRLAALLTYSWGNYGTPPERSSFAAHAIATSYYLDGASFPVGGGAALAAELARTVTGAGGRVLLCAEAEAITAKDGRASGVRLRDGRAVEAPWVISDAGLASTAALLHGTEAGAELARAAAAIGPTLAHCGLYLGLRGEPGELGLERANLWIYDAPPTRAEAETRAWVEGARDAPPAFFVSKACANDPGWRARRPGRSSIVALFNTPWEPFAPWASRKRGVRGEAYEALKARLTREALAAVLARVPEARGAVDHVEMSTPVSTRSFTAHPRGEMAGLAHTPLRFERASTPRAPLRGLALSGQDAWLGGVGGAVFGGVSAASYVLERNLARELLTGR